jgi:hypothetical protein
MRLLYEVRKMSPEYGHRAGQSIHLSVYFNS